MTTKLQFAKDNITWIGRFEMIDALEGAIVELGNGVTAKVKEGLIYLPQWGPVNLRAYSNEELRNFVKKARNSEGNKVL